MEENTHHKTLFRKLKIRNELVPDKQKLTQIFPEEIWNLIFTRHSRSVDLRNVAQGSQYFESYLFPRRSQWLFPFVWQIIAAKLVTQNAEQFTQWLKSLLTLRFVCQTWSKAIDFTFERLVLSDAVRPGAGCDQNFQRNKFVHSKFCLHIINNSQRPSLSDELIGLLNFFKTTHVQNGTRSPVISKTAVISCCYNPKYPMFYADSSWNVCLKVLSTYGKFIRHCRISFLYYEQLDQILELMPNLKTLSINSMVERQEWKRYSLPKLPELKGLYVEWASNQLVVDLVNVCSSLSIFDYCNKGFDISGLINHPLEQLRVCINVNSFTILKTRSFSWPLTHLEITFEKTCFVEWPELFACIHQKWNKTLKRLHITFPKPTRLRHAEQIVQWSFMPLLKLEKLTHLTLVLSSMHTLDFILPVRKTLEYLSLIYGYSFEKMKTEYVEDFGEMQEKQNLKILGHIMNEKLVGSNIWTLFPNLKIVQHSSYHTPCGRFSFERPFDGDYEEVLGRRGFLMFQ